MMTETIERTITVINIVELGENFIPDTADDNGDRDGTGNFTRYASILSRVLGEQYPDTTIVVTLADWGSITVTYDDGEHESDHEGTGNYYPQVEAIDDVRSRVYCGDYGDWSQS